MLQEKTEFLDKRQSEPDIHPAEEFEELLPHLQFMLLWLSNSFELLHFLRTRMHQYVLDPMTSLPPETRHSVAEADREVLAVLEEIVLCTFQQTVYHITKVCARVY